MIRPATPADVPAMGQIAAHAATAAQWSDHDYQRLFTGEPPRLTLVMEDDSVVGFLVARQVGPEWELENLAIAGSAQRRGLGTALLRHFLHLVEEQHGESVFLEVRASNAAACALYQKLGFRETGRRHNYYGHPVEDAVLYRFSVPKPTAT